MTIEEIKIQTARERIKAYIYFGIEAEMEMIDQIMESKIDADTNEGLDKDYHDKQIRKRQDKIERANSRIDDLEVYIGVMSDASNT